MTEKVKKDGIEEPNNYTSFIAWKVWRTHVNEPKVTRVYELDIFFFDRNMESVCLDGW